MKIRTNVSYAKCSVLASYPTTCPLCHAPIPPNVPHECSTGELRASKSVIPAKAAITEPHVFAVDERVRYKPGCGTYGYEDILGPDGRLAGVVVGHTRTRVRVRLTLDFSRIGGRVQHKERCVDAASLVLEPKAKA